MLLFNNFFLCSLTLIIAHVEERTPNFISRRGILPSAFHSEDLECVTTWQSLLWSLYLINTLHQKPRLLQALCSCLTISKAGFFTELSSSLTFPLAQKALKGLLGNCSHLALNIKKIVGLGKITFLIKQWFMPLKLAIKIQIDFFVSYASFTAIHSSFLQLSFSVQSEISGTIVALQQ